MISLGQLFNIGSGLLAVLVAADAVVRVRKQSSLLPTLGILLLGGVVVGVAPGVARAAGLPLNAAIDIGLFALVFAVLVVGAVWLLAVSKLTSRWFGTAAQRRQ